LAQDSCLFCSLLHEYTYQELEYKISTKHKQICLLEHVARFNCVIHDRCSKWRRTHFFNEIFAMDMCSAR